MYISTHFTSHKKEREKERGWKLLFVDGSAVEYLRLLDQALTYKFPNSQYSITSIIYQHNTVYSYNRTRPKTQWSSIINRPIKITSILVIIYHHHYYYYNTPPIEVGGGNEGGGGINISSCVFLQYHQVC